MADQANLSDGTPADAATSKVTTEGSTRVLHEVQGRLASIETGELPVIEKIGPDGTSMRVDPTGEMIRPDTDHLDAVRSESERFAAEHASTSQANESGVVTPTVAPTPTTGPDQERKGLWARIMGWFHRD